MISIVVSIMVMLSIVISAFISFNPNFSRIVENDFSSRAYENNFTYSLKYGQLCIRADTLKSNAKKEIVTPLREVDQSLDHSGEWALKTQLRATITIKDGKDISVNIAKEAVK